MRNVILTGGPGAGKTTLLAELSAMGYATVRESARSVIAERLARGESPRPALVEFAREILRRDITAYLAQSQSVDWVFFDRGLIDALGLLHEASPLPPSELAAMLRAYPFHCPAFILPPWEAIYTTDAERDQTFAEAVKVHARIVHWYEQCGYPLYEVPRLSARARARHVLSVLNEGSA